MTRNSPFSPPVSPGTAAIIGGGVIGGGWAARFLLSGWDVRVFDPDPDAERKVGEVLDNARAALPGLSDTAPPPEGRLTFHPTLSEAAEGAAWIQESVPERLELKRKVYQALQAHCDPGAVIGSSTSGFKPSELQGCATRPEQIVVTHPFNPVYLLPLVELVTTDRNPAALVDRARAVLTGIGMHPLHLKREIDAHIADRFLEAVWREALWLINDGIATTEEIDDAIRFGFGLRWAQMGLFETYRVAGGEAGMRHFIAQFGPCLSWPWTRLMDVPELTDALIDRIAAQSDAQSGAHSIRELERIRDRNLVAILRALKAEDWGAGALLRRAKGRGAPGGAYSRAAPLDWFDPAGRPRPGALAEAFAGAAAAALAAAGLVAAPEPDETVLRRSGQLEPGQTIHVETRASAPDGALVLTQSLEAGGRTIATETRTFRDLPPDTVARMTA